MTPTPPAHLAPGARTAGRGPHLVWQTSDLPANLAGIRAWLGEAALANTPEPIELDVGASVWPVMPADAIFCANTVHIISWPLVKTMFDGIGRVLTNNGLLVLYGPFNYNGQFTSESNSRFDDWLKNRDPVRARHYPSMSSASSKTTCAVGAWSMGSCACAARLATPNICWPSVASTEASAPVAGPGAWPTTAGMQEVEQCRSNCRECGAAGR